MAVVVPLSRRFLSSFTFLDLNAIWIPWIRYRWPLSERSARTDLWPSSLVLFCALLRRCFPLAWMVANDQNSSAKHRGGLDGRCTVLAFAFAIPPLFGLLWLCVCPRFGTCMKVSKSLTDWGCLETLNRLCKLLLLHSSLHLCCLAFPCSFYHF